MCIVYRRLPEKNRASKQKSDPNSKKAGVFREKISKSLQYYSGTLTSWLKDHSKDLRDQIEENFKGLYIKLYDLENYLSFNEFRAIDTIRWNAFLHYVTS